MAHAGLAVACQPGQSSQRGSAGEGVLAVSHCVPRAIASPAEAVADELADTGRKTHALLAAGLLHAAGQARRTKHPLDRARQIKDVVAAASQVHGWNRDDGTAAAMAIQINLDLG